MLVCPSHQESNYFLLIFLINFLFILDFDEISIFIQVSYGLEFFWTWWKSAVLGVGLVVIF